MECPVKNTKSERHIKLLLFFYISDCTKQKQKPNPKNSNIQTHTPNNCCPFNFLFSIRMHFHFPLSREPSFVCHAWAWARFFRIPHKHTPTRIQIRISQFLKKLHVRCKYTQKQHNKRMQDLALALIQKCRNHYFYFVLFHLNINSIELNIDKWLFPTSI